MSSQRAARPHKRDGFWYLIRRVPAQYAALDRRGIVRVSTGLRVSDDPRAITARQVVLRLDDELNEYWRDLAAGRDPDAKKRAASTEQTANQYGFPHIELKDLNAGPLIELVNRLLTMESMNPAQREEVLLTLLGHYPKPLDSTLLSEMPDIYQSIQTTVLMPNSPEQIHKWRQFRDYAVTTFIDIIGGDKKLVDLTSDDVDKVRDHWIKLILVGQVTIDTANKYIGQVAAMFREINYQKKLRLEDPFARSHIDG